MEDVWKQINLTYLNNHGHTTTSSPATRAFHGNMFIQDFSPPLSGNNKDPPKTRPPPPPPKYGASVPPSEISLSTPGSASSSGHYPDFEYPESNHLVKQTPQVCLTKPSYFSHDYDAMPAHSSADHYILFSKKMDSDQNGDRRYKRMMKNRESAARSRSRRQAYTTELELDIKKLAEENAMLKKQHEKLLSDVKLKRPQHEEEVAKKHRLQRTSTCPF